MTKQEKLAKAQDEVKTHDGANPERRNSIANLIACEADRADFLGVDDDGMASYRLKFEL